MPCKNQPCRRGSAPYRRSDWTSRPWAMSKLDCLKQRASRKTPSSDSLDSLEHGLNISETPRSCALQRAPVRWTLTSEPTIGRSLRPCQSRKITEQRIQRLQSRELSRWRHAAEVPRRSTNRPHDTRNKELNSRGKTKPKKQQPA